MRPSTTSAPTSGDPVKARPEVVPVVPVELPSPEVPEAPASEVVPAPEAPDPEAVVVPAAVVVRSWYSTRR